MKKRIRFTVGLVLAAGLCLFLAQPAHPEKPEAPTEVEVNPIWEIFKDGTDESVGWTNAENTRFAVYYDIVIDKETGLVWQRDLGTFMSWASAIDHCYDVVAGSRKGWRVPTMAELSSLIDPNQDRPSLPVGHPFNNLQTFYWSSTTYANDNTQAWYVHFYEGTTNFRPKTFNAYVWCVRGLNEEGR